MQYSIQLPEGYELERIHARVEERARLFHALPGLSHKTYLLDPEDRIYAPFYIWSDVEQAQKFLFDDLFKGLIKTFSRPRVRTWFTLAKDYGDRSITPTFCVKETDTIAPEENLEDFIKKERADHASLFSNPDLYLSCVAFDPDRWELLRYTLWKDKAGAARPNADCVELYDALHVSDI